MSHIIAGRFAQQEPVHEAVDRLVEAGFSADQISAFYCNPPGQHAAFPIGGDHDKSVGAEESDSGWASGASTGGVAGAVIGLAGIPIAGPLGPALGALVGAYTGSLVGSLNSMRDCPQGAEPEADPPSRKAGMVVAVCTESEQAQKTAFDILQAMGADQLEQAEGTIVDGDWKDFDPNSSLVPMSAESTLRPPPNSQTF